MCSDKTRLEMKSCELCGSPARVHCESDQASLCRGCDGRVHGANFLVARHRRSLLCRSCHAPTPWKASGPMLGSAVSLCLRCVARGCRRGRGAIGVGGRRRRRSDDLDPEIYADERFGGIRDDAENQDVPWFGKTPDLSPAGSSSGEDSSSEANGDELERSTARFPVKRRHRDGTSAGSEVDVDARGSASSVDSWGLAFNYRRSAETDPAFTHAAFLSGR